MCCILNWTCQHFVEHWKKYRRSYKLSENVGVGLNFQSCCIVSFKKNGQKTHSLPLTRSYLVLFAFKTWKWFSTHVASILFWCKLVTNKDFFHNLNGVTSLTCFVISALHLHWSKYLNFYLTYQFYLSIDDIDIDIRKRRSMNFQI